MRMNHEPRRSPFCLLGSPFVFAFGSRFAVQVHGSGFLELEHEPSMENVEA